MASSEVMEAQFGELETRPFLELVRDCPRVAQPSESMSRPRLGSINAVKEGDDLMCATRYALMMLRHASTASAKFSTRKAAGSDSSSFPI